LPDGIPGPAGGGEKLGDDCGGDFSRYWRVSRSASVSLMESSPMRMLFFEDFREVDGAEIPDGSWRLFGAPPTGFKQQDPYRPAMLPTMIRTALGDTP
jgi:hypothetical protein